MSLQLTLTDAIAAGRHAMERAEEGAGADFRQRADEFIRNFARFAETPFSSEEVVARARAYGLIAREERAWGAAFQRAARAGVIRRSTETYRRARGHGSLGLKWERC